MEIIRRIQFSQTLLENLDHLSVVAVLGWYLRKVNAIRIMFSNVPPPPPPPPPPLSPPARSMHMFVESEDWSEPCWRKY